MYPISFREAALRVLQFFGSLRPAAKALKISVSTLHRWSVRLHPLSRKRHPRLLNYSELIPVLINAIKDLKAEKDAEVAALNARIDALSNTA